MSYLGKPVLPPYVDEEDLALVALDKGAGWHSAGDLYVWYAAGAQAVGREPVTKKWFGSALKEAGWTSATRKVGGTMTRCWLVTNSWVRRGEQ